MKNRKFSELSMGSRSHITSAESNSESISARYVISEICVHLVCRMHYKSVDHYEAEVYSKQIFASLLELCGEYLWEKESPVFELFQTDSRLGVSSFVVSLNFVDGCLDEWYLIECLFGLSVKFSNICISFTDIETDPLLIECNELLPGWVQGSSDIANRLFVRRGEVWIIIPSELDRVDSQAVGADYLLCESGKCPFLKNKSVNGAIRARLLFERNERLKFPLFIGKAVLPSCIGKLLTQFPQFISTAVTYLPVDRDVGDCVDWGADLDTFGVACTRLQWAKLCSLTRRDVVSGVASGCDLIGGLIVSGLTCAVKRRGAEISAILAKGISESVSVVPNAWETDDSWLHAPPDEPRENSTPIDFSDLLEKLFVDDSQSESDDCGNWSDDSEEREQLEAEFDKLRGDEKDDPFAALANSLNGEFGGPAASLFSHLH